MGAVFVPLSEIKTGSTGVGVAVAVGTGVGVALAVGTGVGVAIAVGVAVGSGTAIVDGIGVFVGLGVEVGVGTIGVTGDSNSASWVGVRVAMGSDSPQATRRISKPTIRSAFCMRTPCRKELVYIVSALVNLRNPAAQSAGRGLSAASGVFFLGGTVNSMSTPPTTRVMKNIWYGST